MFYGSFTSIDYLIQVGSFCTWALSAPAPPGTSEVGKNKSVHGKGET